MQITYKNKVTLQSNPNIPDENKVTAKDMNEIKSAVNSNEEEQQALNLSVQEIAQNVANNSQEISNIKEEQTTQNDNIQTNSNNISDLQSNKADKNEIPTDLSQLSNDNTKFVNETELENAIFQEKTQRQNADNNLQNQIDAITASTDVIDIVGTYQDLQDYDTSKVKQNDVIKVLQDSTHNNAMSYYRWQNQWIYIGSEGPYYTIGQTDKLLQGKANQSDLNQTNTNVTNLAGRVSNNESKIENIEQEQTTQNTNISNNATNIESLQSENENLKKIVSQLPQVTGQGTEVTLENTIEAPFTIFDVEGNSDQETTEGYQLAKITSNWLETSEGITNKARNSGVNLFDGVNLSANTKYYINFILLTKSSSDSTFSGYINNTEKIELSFSNIQRYTVGNKYTKQYTPTENETFKATLWGNSANSTFKFKYWVTTDADADYEKFTYGASPNPNYEQPIYSAGDNENLFDITTATNGYINTNGAVSANDDWKLSQYIEVKNNSSYTMSRSNGARQSFVIAEYDENKTFIKRNEQGLQPIGVNSPYTIKTDAITKYIRINYNNTFQATTIKLEKGNKASGYSPYGMGSINEKITNSDGTKEQDYTIFVQQPRRSIGDVRDIFFKNTVDSPYYDENLTLNGWYERHYIGEKILNGTENWEIYNTHIYLYDNTFKASVESNDYVPNYKCNYFIPDSLFNANTSPNGKILQNVWGALAKHKGIAFNSQDTFSDVATLKTWLSTHNVVVQYELETPLDLPCTSEQVEQLENKPSTYKDFTIINSEDETKAYLEVSGIRDIDTMFDKVTNAIISLGGNV